MIYIDQPTLFIPIEGQRSMLELARAAICTGCPAGTGVGAPPAAPPPYDVYAVLGEVDAPIVASTILGDLGPLAGTAGIDPVQLNGEVAPNYCLNMIEGPDVGLDGLWRLVMDQVIWTGGVGDNNGVYSLAIAIVEAGGDVIADGRILAVGRLSAPPYLQEDGNTLKLSAEIVPCLCLPPAIPDVPE